MVGLDNAFLLLRERGPNVKQDEALVLVEDR